MNNTLYITNIPFMTKEEDLKALFEPFGTVTKITIPTEQDSNRQRGFAFVEFTDSDTAKKAMEALHGKEFNGRQLCIRIAENNRHKSRGRW